MKKDKNVLIVAIVLLAAIAVIVGFSITNDEVMEVNDIHTFTEEYESYNGEELYDHEVLNLDLNDEAIVYITSIDDIVEVMENEDALIYFGFSTCPWCRNMISTLLDAAVSKGEVIYYVDIKEVRNAYTVEDGLLIESTIGEDAYYELLEFLDAALDDYIVTDEDGVEYDTGIKRVYGPTVITVKEGELLDMYIGTLDSVEDPYTALTDEEYEELLEIYKNMINDVQNNACTLDNC